MKKCNKCENVGGFELVQQGKETLRLCATCYEKDKVNYWRTYGIINSEQVKDGVKTTHHIKNCGHTGDDCYKSCETAGATSTCADIIPIKKCKANKVKKSDWLDADGCGRKLGSQKEYEANKCKHCEEYEQEEQQQNPKRERERESRNHTNLTFWIIGGIVILLLVGIIAYFWGKNKGNQNVEV